MIGTFTLLYPERRIVSVEWVLTQGYDAKVNAAVDDHVREHGVFPDDDSGAYESFVSSIAAPDLDACILLLEDLGLATFSREHDPATCWCGCGSTQPHQEAIDEDGY